MSIESDIAAALEPLDPAPSGVPFCTPWATADSSKRPRVTFQTITGDYNEHVAGAGPYRGARQIDVWALSYTQAHGLAAQSKVALRASMTVGGITDNPDDYEADTKLYRASFDVAAWTQ